MALKAILLDADGTLWRGTEAIDGAPQFIRRAHRAGLRCLLISNNAGPNREAYSAKCKRLGLELGEADIFSVNHLAGPYLAKNYSDARVLVIGSDMLVSSINGHLPAIHADAWLAERNATGHMGTPDDLKLIHEADFDVVLIGIDVNVNYIKLALACVGVQRGAVLIGANPDYSFPFAGGVNLPGNGSVIQVVAGVCGVEPATFLGKPSLHLLEQVEAETGIDRSDMIMVGDRIETDIQMAADAGIPAHFVLTGVSTREQGEQSILPMDISEDLEELSRKLGLAE